MFYVLLLVSSGGGDGDIIINNCISLLQLIHTQFLWKSFFISVAIGLSFKIYSLQLKNKF